MFTLDEFIRKIKEVSPEISSQPLCQTQHKPEAWSRPVCCFQNVWEKVKRDEGDICFGWTFIHRTNPQYGDYVIATHHAVWHAPDNKLIDVTPFTESTKHHPVTLAGNILFLVDESALPFENETLTAPLPLKFFALSDNEELKNYINKLAEEEQRHCQEIYSGKVNASQISGVIYKSTDKTQR